MPVETFAERLSVLRAEAERITQYLARLPPEVWQQPSACTAWQVQDVVAHLIGVAEFYADNIVRGLQGDTEPPPGRPPAGTITAAVAAEGVATRAIAARERLGAQLLEKFREADMQLARLLADLPPAARSTPCYHPGGITQAHQFIDLRLKELAVHEWDMRSPREPAVPLSLVCLPAIVRLIDRSIASGSLRWGFRSGTSLPSPVRHRFVMTEPVDYQTDLVVTGDAMRQENAGNDPADVLWQCDTGAFVLLLYGRLPFEQALHDGGIAIAGDRHLAAALTQWFQGI